MIATQAAGLEYLIDFNLSTWHNLWHKVEERQKNLLSVASYIHLSGLKKADYRMPLKTF